VKRLLVLLLLVGCESRELRDTRAELAVVSARLDAASNENLVLWLMTECVSCVVASCMWAASPNDERRSCDLQARRFCTSACKSGDPSLCASHVSVCRAWEDQ